MNVSPQGFWIQGNVDVQTIFCLTKHQINANVQESSRFLTAQMNAFVMVHTLDFKVGNVDSYVHRMNGGSVGSACASSRLSESMGDAQLTAL